MTGYTNHNALTINDNYVQIEIKTSSPEQKEILIAQLAELGYEFEEERALLKAFLLSSAFSREELDEITENAGVTYELSTLIQKNWNQEWEAGFQPVAVDDFCRIRARFHPAQEGFKYDVIITPQMSFGTGHHATTYMMVEAMQKIAIEGRSVLDFGTGTGVLAILASKMGAGRLVAVDNDDWSIENATTNFIENGVDRAELLKADTIDLDEAFEVILANVNRNVILKNLPALRQHLTNGGVVLLSGLLEDDRKTVLEAAERASFKLLFSLERDSWICLAIS